MFVYSSGGNFFKTSQRGSETSSLLAYVAIICHVNTTRMHLKDIEWEGEGWNHQSQVGCCGYGNEPLSFTLFGDFLDQLRHYWRLTRDSAPLS